MSAVNAPQPDAVGPAETFDSTIAAPGGAVSSIGLPGPQTTEAPIHTGALNGIDPYLHRQYVPIATFQWTTAQNPGQVLWKLPIHPANLNMWIAHLWKMYGGWAGGVDLAFKMAGTGFHAGALMFVRMPPYLDADEPRTIESYGAFEWALMDPKTLQVELKSVIDQRPIMYHTGDYDKKNPFSFGGTIIAVVNLPLATSSSGNQSITIGVYAKISNNFQFTQLIPIQDKQSIVLPPAQLLNSLDFTNALFGPVNGSVMRRLVSKPKTAFAYVDKEAINCAQFTGLPMQGTQFQPLITPSRVFSSNSFEGFKFKDMAYFRNPQHEDGSSEEWLNLINNASDKVGISFSKMIMVECAGKDYEVYDNTRTVIVTFYFRHDQFLWIVTYDGPLSVIDNDFKTDNPIGQYQIRFTNQGTTQSELSGLRWTKPDTHTMPVTASMPFTDKEPLDLDKAPLQGVAFTFAQVDATWANKRYAPPINENIVVFEDEFGASSAQNSALKDAIIKSKGYLTEGNSMVFNIVDVENNLAVMPLRLNWNGLLTTLPSSTEIFLEFGCNDKYKCEFVSMLPSTTPMTGSIPLSPAQYYMNYKMSREYASSTSIGTLRIKH